MERKDFTMWDIDWMVQRYIDPDMAGNINTAFETLFLFFEKNGLLKVSVSNPEGKIIKRTLKASEITKEGRLLTDGYKSPVDRWLSSKGRNKVPPDMRILEQALAEARTKE